jgi:hypothetical protein
MNKGIIYMIKCKDKKIKDCYIGSTTNLELRKQRHEYDCMDSQLKVYQFIKANGNFNNFEFEILEDNIEFNNRKELNSIERYYIEEFKSSLNSQIPTRTKKEYNEDNKDKIKKQLKEYRIQHKDKIKEYHQNNKERLTKYNIQYRKENKEELKKNKKLYYQNNKDKILEKMKVKIKCICGSEFRKYAHSRHCKSKKHLQYIENNN